MASSSAYEIVKFNNEEVVMKNLSSKQLYAYLNHTV